MREGAGIRRLLLGMSDLSRLFGLSGVFGSIKETEQTRQWTRQTR